MESSKTITEIMTHDHVYIELLLKFFKDALDQDIKSAEKSFEEFKWELEKHIFVEETVIFKPCRKLGSEICNITLTLSKEHSILLEMLNEAKNNPAAESKIDISKFQELLKKHRDVEEKTLYPQLDEHLIKSQKEMIITRIEEIPVGD